MGVGEITTVIAAMAMLGLHFFRGPNRQYDDLTARLDRAELELAAVRKECSAIALRLAGEHYTRAEIKEMLKEMKEAVDRVQGTVDRVLELQRARHG